MYATPSTTSTTPLTSTAVGHLFEDEDADHDRRRRSSETTARRSTARSAPSRAGRRRTGSPTRRFRPQPRGQGDRIGERRRASAPPPPRRCHDHQQINIDAAGRRCRSSALPARDAVAEDDVRARERVRKAARHRRLALEPDIVSSHTPPTASAKLAGVPQRARPERRRARSPAGTRSTPRCPTATGRLRGEAGRS